VRSRRGKHGGVRDERGIAMTEFVLVLPVLLLVLVGIIAFGLIFFFWLDANRLASETARWAAVDRNPFAPTSLQQHIKDSVPAGMRDDALDVCIDLYSETPASIAIGDPVRVRVEKDFTPFPFLPPIFTVRASATMRIERLPPIGTIPSGPASYKPGPQADDSGDIGVCGD
jgi:TadE-like protein